MYKPTQWLDHVPGVQEGTPLDAENLNNLESGAMEAEALSAFLASHRAAGGNLPHRENLEEGGYCCEVPLLNNYYGMYTEKEWAIKPPKNPATERRTTDRFLGCPVYEMEFGSFTETSASTKQYSMNLDSDKNYTGRMFFIVDMSGAYCKTADQTDVWKPINDGVVSVKVSREQKGGAPINTHAPILEVSAATTPIPAHVVRVRYIFVEQQ